MCTENTFKEYFIHPESLLEMKWQKKKLTKELNKPFLLIWSQVKYPWIRYPVWWLRSQPVTVRFLIHITKTSQACALSKHKIRVIWCCLFYRLPARGCQSALTWCMQSCSQWIVRKDEFPAPELDSVDKVSQETLLCLMAALFLWEEGWHQTSSRSNLQSAQLNLKTQQELWGRGKWQADKRVQLMDVHGWVEVCMKTDNMWYVVECLNGDVEVDTF